MTTNFPQFQSQAPTRYTPPMFMQPQGNLYIIENSLELANVPMGAGISIAICPNESLIYLKMYQNGAPQIAAYNLVPYERKENTPTNSSYDEIIKRLEALEQKLNKKGGQLDEYL